MLSSIGEGAQAHWQSFSSAAAPRLETGKFAPYVVHPLCEVDWNLQIPRRSDQRQMEPWQRIGVYTAGLALADAGMKGDAALLSTMDMIVAAGGGERDIAVDTQIISGARTRNDIDVMLNEKLTTELRPTLFLAQLSNLLAGNISIVHNVTGSSRTFMGEEGAGIAALQTAFARIASGQSTHVLVGGALNAEHHDMLLSYELDRNLQRDDWSPLWGRSERVGGGLVIGSGGAFLVLESSLHAKTRGARIYARLESVAADQVRRTDGALAQSISRLIEKCDEDKMAQLVISAASGAHAATGAERAALSAHSDLVVRGFTGLTGHLKEAQMPFAVGLGALSVYNGRAPAPMDAQFETAFSGGVSAALAITTGFVRAEGAAMISKM